VLDDTPYLAKDPNHAFSVDDLRAWEKKNGRVPKDSFVALRTDMSKDWDRDPERFKRSPFPAWSLDTVKFLIEQRGVTAIGHESRTPPIRWSRRPTSCSMAISRSR
jgi:kynurenine formamidase